MKTKVEVVIRDEAGNILAQLAAHWMNLGIQQMQINKLTKD